jgi:hypothetical protein
VSSGERPGIGHAIRITRIERIDGTLRVHVRVESPAASSSCLLASILTTPFDAVRIPHTRLPVIFLESHRTVACPAE